MLGATHQYDTLFLSFPPECKHLLRSGMLNTDSERRYDITELRLSLWMRGPAVPLTPYSTTKISAEDCLPHWERVGGYTGRVHLPSSPVTGPQTPRLPVHQTAPGPRSQPPSTPATVSVKRTQKEAKRRNQDTSIKTKINSASKKLVHSFTRRPSSSRTESAI